MAHTLLDYMRDTSSGKVEHFEVKEPSLDDVFLQLTGRRIED
ncbi:MAG: ATP-binding protein DrrA1-3 family domain-containing protein [Candidatus Thorarchaeota archaeon]